MIGLHKSGILIVLLGVLALLFVAAPVAAAKLATPVLITPANNQHFYSPDGEFMTLAWKPVSGADGYHLTIQYKRNGTIWTNWSAIFPYISLDNTAYGTAMATDTSYRWNVVAYNSTGTINASSPTAWRTFDITRFSYKLATPTPLSPKTGTTFYSINSYHPLSTFWKPVIGADNYRVTIQLYNTGTGSWQDVVNRTTTGIPYPSRCCLFDNLPSSGDGRWRVSAVSGFWKESDPTKWQTFTYK